MTEKSDKRRTSIMGSYATVTLAIMINTMYINTFATEVLMISPGKLAIALAVAKGIDLCVSFVSGYIIEKVPLGQKGKYQGWLYYARWVLAVACLVEVVDTSAAPLLIRIVILVVAYIILNSTLDLLQPAYYGAVSVASGLDMTLRDDITISFTRQSTIATLISSMVPMFVSRLPFGRWNYFVTAMLLLIPMPIALGKMSAQIEGEAPAGAARGDAPPITFSDMVSTLVKNPQMLVLFLSHLLFYVGMYTYINIYSYYFIVIVQDFSLMSVSGVISSAVGVVSALFLPKLGVKIGKKWANAGGFFLFGLGLVGIYLTGRISWVWYTVCMSISICGTELYTAFTGTMYLDCGEWYLWKTGKDTRAIASGLQIPPIKLGMLIGGSLGLAMLSATGYYSGFTPDETWAERFMFSCWIVPAIIYFMAGALLAIFYKISDSQAEEYARINQERMNDL